MRCLFGFMCVLALGVMGCSEATGTGGSAGDGGSGGVGGDGGSGGTPATEAVRVAFIGASITEPVGTPTMPVNYPEHLELLLGDDFELGNFGVGGATMQRTGDIPYWDLPEYAQAKALEPHVVTIMLGTNDTKPQNWDAARYEADYRDMIEEMQALSSEPTILLLRPVPVFGENMFMIRGDVVRDEVLPIIDRLGTEYDLAVVDLYSALLEHGDLFPDAVHPTAEGGRLIAEELVGPIVDAAMARGFGVSRSCEGSVCQCSEAGIRTAIAEGGGPYTFDCDVPTIVETEASIVIDSDVILDGEGDLTVDGSEDVFVVSADVTAELRGLVIAGDTKSSGIYNEGTLTVTNSTISGSPAVANGGALAMTNSTVSGDANRAIGNENGTLTMMNSTVS